MSLLVVTQPIAEPVTVEEVKLRLRLSTTDDDALIASHITTAREFAESVTGWSLAAKDYADVRDGFPYQSEHIWLPRPPLVSVTAIKYLDDNYEWQTWDPLEYWVADANYPACVTPRALGYPRPNRTPGSVRIEFTTGSGGYGPHLEGVRQLAAHLYEHPEVITPESLKEMPKALTEFFKVKRVHTF